MSIPRKQPAKSKGAKRRILSQDLYFFVIGYNRFESILFVKPIEKEKITEIIKVC